MISVSITRKFRWWVWPAEMRNFFSIQWEQSGANKEDLHKRVWTELNKEKTDEITRFYSENCTMNEVEMSELSWDTWDTGNETKRFTNADLLYIVQHNTINY